MDQTLDMARLREIFDDDRESIVEILHECAAFVRGSLDELSTAFASGDATGVSRAAHAIKGSCGNVGAIACESAAHAIEVAARSGSVASDGALALRALVGEFEAAIARYERERPG